MRVFDRLSRIWDKAAPWLVAGLGAFVLILTIDNHVLGQQNLNSQNNHHAQNVASQAQIKQLLGELTQEAAAIEYEGGVITFLTAENGQKDDEIIAAQQQGHALLMAVTAIEAQLSQAETSVGGALVKGQAQINAYLHYLTCIGTNPTDTAVCGAAPPLPAT